MTTDFFCDRPEPLPGIAALAGAYAAPDVLADRQAIAEEPPGRPAAPSIQPTDLVERLAASLASMAKSARFSKDPGAVWQSQQPVVFWRSQARQRLHRLDPVARRLLVRETEADARLWAAQEEYANGNGR